MVARCPHSGNLIELKPSKRPTLIASPRPDAGPKSLAPHRPVRIRGAGTWPQASFLHLNDVTLADRAVQNFRLVIYGLPKSPLSPWRGHFSTIDRKP